MNCFSRFPALLLTLAMPFAAAQHPSKAPGVLPGSSIVMPPKLLAGDRATLAVLDSAGRLVAGAEVELGGGEKIHTDLTGRAAFAAPLSPGEFIARLPGRAASAVSATVITLDLPPPDGVVVLQSPRNVTLTDRFAVEGTGFHGDADRDEALIGGRPALVLAASPVSLVILPPPDAAPGLTQLVVQVNGRSPGPVPITVLALQVLGLDRTLLSGESGTLFIRVRGTDQPVLIELRNLSPQVAELEGGNNVRVTSSGGRENLAGVTVHGLRRGKFSVSARLVPSS